VNVEEKNLENHYLLPPRKQGYSSYPLSNLPFDLPHHPQPGQGVHNSAVVVGQKPSFNVHVYPCPETYFGLTLFACLCCFWPAALFALYYSSQVRSLYNAGDYGRANNASSRAKWCSGLAVIVGAAILSGGCIVLVAMLVSEAAP
jgi:hypothetical protein